MGAAEVVPGVSGGTIAFVTGIYERLVNAIQKFTPMLLGDLKNKGLRQTWIDVDGNFLVSLLSGMAISIVLFASGLSYLLDHEAVLIWSFFFGLVAGSIWLVVRQISRFGWDIGFIIVAGGAFGFTVSNLVPIELEPSLIYIFLGGAIAVCAWILPGLSGSFILLILGLYRVVLEAIRSMDVVVLLVLGAGCAIGIVSFSRLVASLFREFRNETLAALTGFMLGSLTKIWPWQHIVSYQIKSDGSQVPLVQEPVSPFAYPGLTGNEADFLMAGIGLILGGIGVVGLNILARLGLPYSNKSIPN